jgi:flagellar biosynthesis protein FlhB
MADGGQKTEQPTQRRLKKAREEGNFPSARHFVSGLQFLTFVAMLRALGGEWLAGVRQSMALLLEHALGPQLEQQFLIHVAVGLLVRCFTPVAYIFGAVMVVTLAAQLTVTRFGFTLKKLWPDLSRLNPVARIRELPKQNIPAVLQAIVLLPVFGFAVYRLVVDNLTVYLTLPLMRLPVAVAQVTASLDSLLWKAATLFVVFGAVDLLRQQRRYQKQLRMSKQEIRDEIRELEGNPVMKQRIRRLSRDLARRRMMQEVPKATAVIVNPTHFAVALKYDMHSPGAPKVVAKGKNYLALRIRQKAIENQVPLIENPPLAQALYKSVEVGQEIPANFYRAVAEILAYVFRVVYGRRPAGAQG